MDTIMSSFCLLGGIKFLSVHHCTDMTCFSFIFIPLINEPIIFMVIIIAGHLYL